MQRMVMVLLLALCSSCYAIGIGVGIGVSEPGERARSALIGGAVGFALDVLVLAAAIEDTWYTATGGKRD